MGDVRERESIIIILFYVVNRIKYNNISSEHYIYIRESREKRSEIGGKREGDKDGDWGDC